MTSIPSRYYFIFVLGLRLSLADELDEVLISSNGMFGDDVAACERLESSSSTSFSSSFISTDEISNWNSVNLQYEEDAFGIDMTHNDTDPARQWNIRIGKGGQIVSFIVSPGESIANQAVQGSIWNDLVQQMVAVDQDLNTPSHPNFIHGSGVYGRGNEDGTIPPFYDPKLAMNCEGNDCGFINWGQQAHVPTPHNSPLLYYTRYRDCGEGVIQYDMAMYHFGEDPNERYEYFNTPWTGVRTSTFKDILISNKDGDLDVVNYLGPWGSSHLQDLDTTGGFTTFAEEVPISVPFTFPFCVEATNENAWHNCNTGGLELVPFKFQEKEAGKAFNTGHWSPLGLSAYSVAVRWCDLDVPIKEGASGWGRPGRLVTITNDRTNFSFQSDYIIHYCWDGAWTYMGSTVTADVINANFAQGDTITVSYSETSGREWEDQNGLTFVHGTADNYPQSWHRGKSRIRYGTTNNLRDGTVFTTNLLGKLSQKEVYSSRKFMVSDLLSNMESKGMQLSDEAYEDVYSAGTYGSGETIRLWSSGSSFGASVSSDFCGDATLVCTGSSSPGETNWRPLFYINCGGNIVTSHNPYELALIDGNYKKPYKCLDETGSYNGRAEWKLLGFFPDGACSAIGNKEYSSTFCVTTDPQACYLSSVCPSGSNDRGEAGIISRSDPGFTGGSYYNSDWRWYHPRLCCADDIIVDSNVKAMCPTGDTKIGHWVDGSTYAVDGDPYGSVGGGDNVWKWSHPYTCDADSPSRCVFSESKECQAGFVRWGKARIIMSSSASFPHVEDEYNSDWNYHTPWLCCDESTPNPTTIEPSMNPSSNPSIDPSSQPSEQPSNPSPTPAPTFPPTNLPTPSPTFAGPAHCRDIPDWHDNDGPIYNCEWYGLVATRCADYGVDHANGGLTASNACCICGGGETVSPLNCEGYSDDWYDVDGPYYNCDWYAVGDRCERYGDSHERLGQTASQACCACNN